MPLKTVISASRRTDIPAFYMDWFMKEIESGSFHVKNPFNQKVSVISATPEAVHSIVFWSKNVERFLSGGYGPRLEHMGYNLFFLFTINSASKRLEPNLPPLENRIKQMEALVNRFGSGSVWWRFDPICFFHKGDNAVYDNLENFPWIAQKIADLGIDRCITSFMNIYRKVTHRANKIPGFSFIDPPVEKKIRVLRKMADTIKPMHLSLYTCCENEVLAALPQDCNIKAGGCISNRYLAERFGGRPSYGMDAGQRRAMGCECMASRDIGGYDDQPCFHNCLYCYARPEEAENSIENMNQTGKHEQSA